MGGVSERERARERERERERETEREKRGRERGEARERGSEREGEEGQTYLAITTTMYDPLSSYLATRLAVQGGGGAEGRRGGHT
jgi:hypothetical protein